MDSFFELFDQWWAPFLVPAILFVIHLVSVLSAFHALQHVRTSQAVVAWVVGLITLPYLTLPLYWVFARHRFEGYREAIREVGVQHQHSVTAIRRELLTEPYQRTTTLNSPLEQLADVLDTPISTGNQFRLLVDGDQFFDAVLNQIQAAKSYIYASFYIIRDDELGNRFADALIERSKAGVTVRLLYDEVGCIRLSNAYLNRLSESGVDVRAFNTRQGWTNRFQVNFRNHRKLIVIDGKRAFIGGMNVGDEYLGKAAWASRWRDTGVEVSGNITRKIQAVFAGDYYWAARADLAEADWSCDSHDDATNSMDSSGFSDVSGLAAVCATGPADLRPRASMMFAAIMAAAKERLWISTPYLVPDDPLMLALTMAKMRGVDVRLLIPTVADQWAVYLAGFHYENQLAELGIPVYRFNEGMLHQKCILVDDSLVLVGSTNLDNRSLYLNFELMIAIRDREFIAGVVTMLEQDFANAQHSNALDLPSRPWFARAGTAVARLFSPIL